MLFRKAAPRETSTERLAYLSKWFTPEILCDLERLKHAAEEVDEPAASILLVTASDLLREWSLQDPADLRIRRRQSPLPETPFMEAWKAAVEERIGIIAGLQPCLHAPIPASQAMLADSRISVAGAVKAGKFDFVVTSPPYATALPYIDTQRLSLVWLGLIEPEQIRTLEAGVLGSREVLRGRQELVEALRSNAGNLPEDVIQFCRQLHDAVGERDGFRRQAVPSLLYRYLDGMKATFANLHRLLRSGGRMAWVVGVNQTTLSGKLMTIDTPGLLCRIAAQAGFTVEEPIPLQTYQRYGVHQKNSIRQESVLLFRR
jgi:adenine-specific DNA methylase